MKGTEIILKNEFGEYSVATSEEGLNIDELGNLIASIIIAAGYNPDRAAKFVKQLGKDE